MRQTIPSSVQIPGRKRERGTERRSGVDGERGTGFGREKVCGRLRETGGRTTWPQLLTVGDSEWHMMMMGRKGTHRGLRVT